MSSSASPSSHNMIFSASGCAEKRLSRLYGRCESMTWSVACSGRAKYSERSTRDPKLSRMIVRSCDEEYTRKQCQLLHHHPRARTCDCRSSVPLAVLRPVPLACCGSTHLCVAFHHLPVYSGQLTPSGNGHDIMAYLVMSEQSHKYPARTQRVDIGSYEYEDANLASVRC